MSTRTNQQNKSLHKFFEQLAEKLNDAGYDVPAFYELTKGKLDCSWNKDLVKERLWRPYQEAIVGKESTTKLSRSQVNEVYEELNMRIAQLTGVSVPFPSEETMHDKA